LPNLINSQTKQGFISSKGFPAYSQVTTPSRRLHQPVMLILMSPLSSDHIFCHLNSPTYGLWGFFLSEIFPADYLYYLNYHIIVYRYLSRLSSI